MLNGDDTLVHRGRLAGAAGMAQTQTTLSPNQIQLRHAITGFASLIHSVRCGLQVHGYLQTIDSESAPFSNSLRLNPRYPYADTLLKAVLCRLLASYAMPLACQNGRD